jgi:hypothetical protein
MNFFSSAYGRNRVLLIGRGVAYRKTEETDLCWSAYGRNGVLFIGRGVACRKMGLHGLPFIHRLLPRSSSTGYCSSTVDFLQPPHALFTRCGLPSASTSYCSSTATVQPASTGYCSTSPPRGPVHPPPTGSGVWRPPLDRGPVHPAATASTTTGSCSSNPHRELFIQPQTTYVSTRSTNPHVHCSSRGSRFDRLQQAAAAAIARSGSVSSSSEGITRVQLTARDRSLWFSSVASAIALVQLESNASLGFS